jgi:GTP-binding protein EngB required for normal cell division
MEKNIYAMCGYSNWGKSYTLYEMFNKKNFQPEKSPVQTDKIPNQNSILINASIEDKPDVRVCWY